MLLVFHIQLQNSDWSSLCCSTQTQNPNQTTRHTQAAEDEMHHQLSAVPCGQGY